MKHVATLLFLTVCPLLQAAQPNILVLFSDDHGYADLGCQGSPDVKTPHIDSLAANGVRCTAGYVTAPQCAPSRAGLVSGRYQQRFGADDNPTAHHMLLKGGKTIGDQFKANGYATGHFGKWHLGDEAEITQHGFDESFGFADEKKMTAETQGSETNKKVAAETQGSETNKRGKRHIQDDRIFAAKAADFIERRKDQPWCVYLAFHAPHGEHTELAEYRSKYSKAPKARQGLLSAMSMLDDSVGMVLEKLRSLDLEKDTLIFFIGDNGGTRFPEKTNNNWQKGSENTPFRGGKGISLEGGIRVPFLVQWKGVIPSGKTYDRPVISLDVTPTALAAAGATPIPDSQLDGVNLLPFLKGKESSDPHEVLFWRWRKQQAIRMGDWKLVKNRELFNINRWVLIDLKTDIEERTDLTAKHPEIAKDLQQRWDAWNASLPPIGPERNDDETEE